FRSACRRTGQGSWFLYGSRLSPQRTLLMCPSGNEGLNLFIGGGCSKGEISREDLKSHRQVDFSVIRSIPAFGGSRRFLWVFGLLDSCKPFFARKISRNFRFRLFAFSRFFNFRLRARSRRSPPPISKPQTLILAQFPYGHPGKTRGIHVPF